MKQRYQTVIFIAAFGTLMVAAVMSLGYISDRIQVELDSVCQNEGFDEHMDTKWISDIKYIECIKYDSTQKQIIRAWFPEHKGD